ncbi:MAG: hypothetical protein DMG05_12545 [Acidobacteria bacterium]|nr:MAG: hypothetical protein DMG05_12545 [Acidobacteriota bacterium]
MGRNRVGQRLTGISFSLTGFELSRVFPRPRNRKAEHDDDENEDDSSNENKILVSPRITV